ncbi:MAG TPA: 23S rRNA (uracil(1939)-C(5))-methyltransferase RlmD [Bacteroidetes bacterium]|nr:23S rRNA (uracil(1939)-C(5))-methyltransferase RlmD [Bacteroidota bacterium]
MGRKQKRNYIVEAVPIVDTSSKGKGVGRKEDFVVFVKKAVPGDLVDVRVTGKEKGVPDGLIEKMIKESPDRVTQRCQHFGDCGGCKWQNLSYEKQLFYKQKQVLDAIHRIGHLEIGEERPILGCELQYNYRNKVEFSFSNRQWVPSHVIKKGEPIDWYGAVGYHVARFFDKIIDIETCHLHRPIIDDIRNEVRRFTRDQEAAWYDLRMHHGYYRNMVFRTSEGSGELMLIMLVGEDDLAPVQELFTHLEAKFPEITSFVWIYNHKPNSTYGDLEARLWKGTPYITEHLGEWKFRVSPTSFFQTNTFQAKVLYDEVRKAIGEKVGIIYDLYCGAGSIGIYANDLAEKVVGIEYVDAAVKDAYTNIEINGLSHLSFHAGNMRDLLDTEFVIEHGHPDVVITDPPRAGMDAPVVKQLLKIRASKIVYVSCNPATQARDLEMLCEVYDLVYIQPVDMFPQTSHVENVALLVLK